MSARRKRGAAEAGMEDDENGSDENDDEEEEEEEESDEPIIRKRMPSRSTRGKRMDTLLDAEEEEADESFWGQDAWAEQSEDEDVALDEYDTDERQDSEDSDISEDEADADDDVDAEATLQSQIKRNRAERSKRTGVYQDPALKRKQQAAARDKLKSRGTPAPDQQSAAGSPARATRAARASVLAVKTPATAMPRPKRSLRASTKTKTEVAKELRTVEEATARKKRLQRQRKQPASAAVEMKLTQRQLLEAAAKTEIENKRSLKVMLLFQAERKRQASTRTKHTGPRVRLLSRRGLGSLVTFTGVDRVPTVINSTPVSYPEPPVCAITGLPARYRDPRTGVPYATLEAFKAIRSRSNSHAHSSHKNSPSQQLQQQQQQQRQQQHHQQQQQQKQQQRKKKIQQQQLQQHQKPPLAGTSPSGTSPTVPVAKSASAGAAVSNNTVACEQTTSTTGAMNSTPKRVKLANDPQADLPSVIATASVGAK
jgi:vacuolar protein sorting-associated protein 72